MLKRSNGLYARQLKICYPWLLSNSEFSFDVVPLSVSPSRSAGSQRVLASTRFLPSHPLQAVARPVLVPDVPKLSGLVQRLSENSKWL